MSHHIKLALFSLVPVIGAVLIYGLWAEQLNLNMVKVICSVVILESVVWVWAALGKKQSDDAPAANNTHGAS